MSETLDYNPKTALGNKKPQPHLFPPAAIIRAADVMGLGAEKYGAYNWRETGAASTVYYSAAMRHLMAWFDGEDADPESGQSHLAHVLCCMAILIDADSIGKLIDNRPTKGAASAIIAGDG